MKRVGISCRMTEESAYHELRNSLALDWITFCAKIQVIPVLIPNGLKDAGQYCVELALDAVILSGGNNIAPKLYGSEEELSDVYEIRDKAESSIIQYCIGSGIPLLGICRGMFMINAFFDGSLTHQVTGHVCSNHPVQFQAYTDVFGTKKIVNSYHNQAIFPINLAVDLEPFAHVEDGSIEAFKHRRYNIFGLLWHPERELDDYETQRFIYSILIEGD